MAINQKKYSGFLGILFAVLLSLLIYIYRDPIIKLQSFGYFGLFLLNIFGSATLFLPTPLFLTAFAAASVLNPILVTIVASLGSGIGEITGYIAGFSGKEILDDNLKTKRIQKWVNKYGLWAIFVLAAIPNPVFDMAGIVAGTTGIPVIKFLIAVWCGKLIKFGAIAFLGVNSADLINRLI